MVHHPHLHHNNHNVGKLNVLAAANSTPDICFTYNDGVMYNYVKNDGLTNLGEVLGKYAPYLKNYLGQTLLDYGKWNNVWLANTKYNTLESKGMVPFGSFERVKRGGSF